MFCSKHVDVKQHSVYFPEIKHLPIFFCFEFISLINRGLLSAAPCISSLKMSLRFNASGSVSFKLNLQHAWQLHGFVTSLIHMVQFVMCLGEYQEDLVQLQVLLLQLWFWKGLERSHGSLLHNEHVRQGLAVQVHDAFWKPLCGKCTSPDYCTQ